MNNINLLRNEERFFITADKWPAVHRALKDFLQELKFSDNKITQTVYLDTDEQEVSWDTSIKARRFLMDFSIAPKIKLEDEFECENKTNLLNVKTKTERKTKTLGQFVREQSQSLGLRLRPYFVIEYDRKHFIRPDQQGMRLTVDRFVRYWYLENFKLTALPLATEHEICRIELKYDPVLADPKTMQRLDALLKGVGAMPINSKKESAFDYHFYQVNERLPAIMPLKTNLKGVEIEAKLNVDSLDSVSIFQKIKNKLSDNKPLRVCPAFPNMLTLATINHYFQDAEQNPVRVAFHQDDYHFVFKNQGHAYEKNTSILERAERETSETQFESKKFKQEISNLKLKPVGWLERVRKAFFVENIYTGFVYHTTMDRCQAINNPQPLCQIEIEYFGISPNKHDLDISRNLLKEMILSDIKSLQDNIAQIIQDDPNTHITPSSLSKYKWLTQQK